MRARTLNVSIFYDTTLIGTLTVYSDVKTVAFSWDLGALPEGAYTISANASIVPGETNTTNNYFLDGQVRNTFNGEVTADGVVDLSDLFELSEAYGSTTLSEDINSDGIVDYTDFSLWQLAWDSTDPYADIDNNGHVGIEDYYMWEAAFGQTGSPNWNPYADMNADNKVDASDLFDLSKNYGKTM